MRRNFIISILSFGLLFLSGFFVHQTKAATFIVTNNADSGTGSFRQAVLNANSAVTDDVIGFTSALSGATITLSSEIFLGGVGSGTLTISGLGANRLTIDGGPGNNRIFQTAGTVTIRGLTLQNGGSPTFADIGSAIRGNFGTIVLDDLIIQNNQSNQNGAVFFQLGSGHRITNTSIVGNTANVCAGLRIDRTDAIITNTTISGNSTTAFSGAGGCFFDGAMVTMLNSTIASNTTGSGGTGGGLNIAGGAFPVVLTLSNTIVAGNSAPSNPDISLGSGASIQTLGGNLIGNNGSVTTSFPAGNPNANSDKVNVAPNLGPLGNYGGTTPTCPLLPGSPAIDAGLTLAQTPATDQRGAARSGAVDAGAFEGNPAYTAILPSGTVNQGYSTTLAANSGSFTYTQTGGTLPPGLSLTTAFAPAAVVAVSGTPVFAGNYSFAVTASSGATSITTNYSLAVTAAPTAAAVSISGKVLTSDGRGLQNALVTLTDSAGRTRTFQTGTFGYFRFEEVASGEIYVIGVSSKRYRFTPQIVTVNGEISELNLTANE
jgi:hypothetical protein